MSSRTPQRNRRYSSQRRRDARGKPLAVIGRAASCYSGVWSHQTVEARGTAGPRLIEPITVSTLGEVVKRLTCEVHTRDEPFQAV